jgi:hypothetical protein
MGTDIVQSTRPDLTEEGMEPIQCINGHWTTTGDLDNEKCCSQCPIIDENKEEEEDGRIEDLYRGMMENLWDDTEEMYDDGTD